MEHSEQAEQCCFSKETLDEKVAREHADACREIQMYLCSLTKQFGEDGVPGDDVVKRVKTLGRKMAQFDKQLDDVFRRIDRAKAILDGGGTYDDLANAVRKI